MVCGKHSVLQAARSAEKLFTVYVLYMYSVLHAARSAKKILGYSSGFSENLENLSPPAKTATLMYTIYILNQESDYAGFAESRKLVVY